MTPGISRARMVLAAAFALVIAAVVAFFVRSQPADPVAEIDVVRLQSAAGAVRFAVDDGMSSPVAPHPASGSVPSLASLLPGLEAKVRQNPRDRGLQLLLAQTYSELGQRDKGLTILRALRSDGPADAHTDFAYATVLMDSTTASDLREAYGALETAGARDPEIVHFTKLYQGDIELRLGNPQRAAQIWETHLTRLPAGDPRRKAFEERLSQTEARK